MPMILKNAAPVIIDAVNKMTKKAGSRNPEEICETYHIKIREVNMKQRIKAYYYYQSRIHNIVLDEGINDIFRKILLAHELGHFSLHKKIAMMQGFHEMDVLEKRDTDPMETEANLFAAELLLPDDDVIDCLQEHTFFETAKILNVPHALLDFKFSMLQSKDYRIRTMDVRKADFLKEDLGAYDSHHYD